MTTDTYLAGLPEDRRMLLEKLRREVLAHVPDAEECISYGLPAFRWRGEIIGGFAATAKGASFYPFSGATLTTLGKALGTRSRTKSALHFHAAAPLPKALVKKLLNARMAEVRVSAREKIPRSHR